MKACPASRSEAGTKIYGFSAFGEIIGQTFSETVLAFQYGQAYQAHLPETGSLQPFVIEINAAVFILKPPDR
jgi:hypothetical protein